MKYKLYTTESYKSPIEQVLKGRKIDNIEKWLNANEEDIESWRALKNIEKGVYKMKEVIDNGDDATVIVDCDVDGFTSAAILFNYLYSLYPSWCCDHLGYLLHKGKEHGLSDLIEEIPGGTRLIICPDSASNDYEQHEFFADKADILILDHHEAPHESESKNTITINNQLCDYKNKMLSGGGVTWQFCRAYNEIFDLQGEINNDLCALSLSGDMMSYRSIETKALVDIGFSNITNPFFHQMTLDNEYTLNKYGGIGYKAVAFAVVPFINATIRSGTQEEKELVFKAMCKQYCFENVPNTKRGHKGEEWSLYKQAAYVTASAKRRQTNLETQGIELLEKKIVSDNLLDNAVLIFKCEPGEVEPNIRGLVANKFASKYQRPCLVLTKSKSKDNQEYSYRGSLRNYGQSEIENLKQIFEDTGLTEYVQGHESAAGIGIAESNLQNFINVTNDLLKDKVGEVVFWVDYIWKMNQADPNKLLQLAEMSSFWGQDVPASQVAITDIDLSQCRLSLCGQKNNTLRMVLPNGLVLVKFGIDEEIFDSLTGPNLFMSCIVTPTRNEWMGKVSGEGLIDDFEIKTKWIF